MYGALWRILPGPGWLKAAQLLVLLAAVLLSLHFWVFPWVQELIGAEEVQVGAALSGARVG